MAGVARGRDRRRPDRVADRAALPPAARAPYIAITTLAFSEIARIVCMNLVGLTRGELGLWGFPDFRIFPSAAA